MEGIEQIESLHAERRQNGMGMDEEAYLIAVCQLNLLQRVADALEALAKKENHEIPFTHTCPCDMPLNG